LEVTKLTAISASTFTLTVLAVSTTYGRSSPKAAHGHVRRRAIGALADAVTILGDTHVGMLAEKPKDAEQYTATQMSEFAQATLDSH
jgi:alkylhydroperoxidase family enzyme